MEVLGILFGLATLFLLFYTLYKECVKPTYLGKLYTNDIEDKVRWIVIKSFSGTIGNHRTSKTVRDMELFEYIEEEQYRLNVDDKYRIDFSTEKNRVCEILETHRQMMIESYFFNSLKQDKAQYNLDYLEYYMWSLCCFLGNNLAKTDHGITYYKLYYVVSRFCENNKNIKQFFVPTFNTIKYYLEKEK